MGRLFLNQKDPLLIVPLRFFPAALALLSVVPAVAASARTLNLTYTYDSTRTAPLTVSFQATSSDPAARFEWDFGDGSRGQGARPVHVYYRPGRYTVQLTATLSGGSVQRGNLELQVLSAGPPVARAVLLPTLEGGLEVSSEGSRTEGPVTRTVWTLAGRSFEGPGLRFPPLNPGNYDLKLRLEAQGTAPLERALRFKLARFTPRADLEESLHRLANSARARGWRCDAQAFGGLSRPALRRSATLDRVARAQAAMMAANHFFAHTSPVDGSDVAARARAAGYRYRLIAENLAMGTLTPETALLGWQRSPGHCRNLMSDVLEVGYGYAQDPADPRVSYWVQVLGTPE
ncbi:uncharacterized protein YkwD [Deinobacterium chartae]|uniref:Uncharacterized protein YkwD n=1 Tax=Deinobacterium chartae TaxID=521158 RepID=A0A841I0J7_9DEIO|nr:PKD domain-containing protein [Deinobacterium chartae]MBB6098723.1 uncharacterized protein YkwD [Deinobacterium chartae]